MQLIWTLLLCLLMWVTIEERIQRLKCELMLEYGLIRHGKQQWGTGRIEKMSHIPNTATGVNDCVPTLQETANGLSFINHNIPGIPSLGVPGTSSTLETPRVALTPFSIQHSFEYATFDFNAWQ